jgi:hypothetical protein
LQRRIDRKQAELEALKQHTPSEKELENNRVAQFVGRSILRAKGYWPSSAEHRPRTFGQGLVANTLEKLAANRRQDISRAHSIAKNYGAKDSRNFEPDFTGPRANAMRRETKEIKRKEGSYRRDLREADVLNEGFAGLIAPERTKMQKLIIERDNLMRRLQVIENIRQGRPVDWHEAEPENQIQFDPDSRGMVTLARVTERQGGVVELGLDDQTIGRGREIIADCQDGTTLYIRGDKLYSWRSKPDGTIELGEMQDIDDDDPKWQQAFVIGYPWQGGDRQPTRSNVVTVFVKTGSLNSGLANERGLDKRGRDIFSSAAYTSRQVYASYAPKAK